MFLSILALAFGAAFAIRGLATTRPTPAAKPPAAPVEARTEDDRARLDALLANVEANVPRYARTRALCPAVAKSATVPSVLAADRDDGSYMTSPSIRTALDRNAANDVRLKAAHEAMSAPYVAVIAAATKDVVKRRGSWNASFDGWLYLVDTKTAQPVCAAPITFESSTKVRERRQEDAAMRALRDDLEKRFHRESANALSSIAGKNLTLEQ